MSCCEDLSSLSKHYCSLLLHVSQITGSSLFLQLSSWQETWWSLKFQSDSFSWKWQWTAVLPQWSQTVIRLPGKPRVSGCRVAFRCLFLSDWCPVLLSGVCSTVSWQVPTLSFRLGLMTTDCISRRRRSSSRGTTPERWDWDLWHNSCFPAGPELVLLVYVTCRVRATSAAAAVDASNKARSFSSRCDGIYTTPLIILHNTISSAVAAVIGCYCHQVIRVQLFELLHLFLWHSPPFLCLPEFSRFLCRKITLNDVK